jgi:uncharacterized protein (TIGR03545 family)/uncharacterized protein (TIGR03546 family)
MGFILKLLKELNSAQSEKLVSLAVVLGLIAGFLPFFNVFTFLIFLVAFIIRVPLGLFLASWGVFEIIGALLDPLFATSGYYILTSSFLKPLWEFIYNLPLMRWSGYNNTVVIGGFVWGVVIGGIIFVLMNKSFSFYREKLSLIAKKYKFLSWIVPSEYKKKSFIRISGILAASVIFGSIFLVFSLFFDPLLKKITEFSLSKIFHKPVKIEKLKTSFFNAKIDIKNLQIGKIKTDDINLKLSWDYLVWKKFDIEKLIINNIHSNKSIKQIIQTTNTSQNKTTLPKKLKLNIPNPKNLLACYELESVKKIKVLKEDYKKLKALKSELKKVYETDKEKTQKIKQDIDSLKNEVKNIKSLNDVNKILSKIETIKKEINSLQNQIKTQNKKYLSLKDKIIKDLNDIKKAIKLDYVNISKKYDMLKKGEYYKFAESFLKPQVQNYIHTFMKYYELIKPYMRSEKKEEIIRNKGIYIKYTDKIKYPDFVLENAKISGKLKDADAKIAIVNLASDQQLLGKHAKFTIVMHSIYFTSANVNITYLNIIAMDFNIKKLFVKKMDLNKLILNDIKCDIKGKGILKRKDFDLSMLAVVYPKNIVYPNSKNISKVLSEVKSFKINITAKGKYKSYKLEITSDLDKKLSNIFKSVINKEIIKSKQKLNQLLNEKVNSELKNTGFNVKDLDINDFESLNKSLDSLKKELTNYSKEYLKKQILKKGIGNFIKF